MASPSVLWVSDREGERHAQRRVQRRLRPAPLQSLARGGVERVHVIAHPAERVGDVLTKAHLDVRVEVKCRAAGLHVMGRGEVEVN